MELINIPKPYPDPIINNTSDVLEYANTVTNGWMVTGFLISCVCVVFFLLKTKFYKTSDASAIAFLITMMLGSMLWTMGLVESKILMIFVIGTIATVLWCVFDSK